MSFVRGRSGPGSLRSARTRRPLWPRGLPCRSRAQLPPRCRTGHEHRVRAALGLPLRRGLRRHPGAALAHPLAMRFPSLDATPLSLSTPGKGLASPPHAHACSWTRTSRSPSPSRPRADLDSLRWTTSGAGAASIIALASSRDRRGGRPLRATRPPAERRLPESAGEEPLLTDSARTPTSRLSSWSTLSLRLAGRIDRSGVPSL